ALANYEAIRAPNALKAESQSQNGSNGDNGNGGNRNGGNGNGNHGEGGNNGNGNPNENGRGAMPLARMCVSRLREMSTAQLQRDRRSCSALTWWNSHKRTIGVDAAFAMT
ncbi:hypothetical protein Tco_0310640, partial [Tanacetum coccineum]